MAEEFTKEIPRARRRPNCRPALYELLSLGERELRRAFLKANSRAVEGGTSLVAPDCPSPALYRLSRGWAIRTRFFPDGRRAILGVYVMGDIVGIEHALLDHSADEVVTACAATVQPIESNALSALMTRPATAVYLAWLLSEAQRRSDSIAAALSRLEARERIAMMLLDFQQRLRQRELIIPGSYNLPLTQQQIGDYLGLTVVHVNRMLRWFRSERIAYVDKHLVIIKDLERLKLLAAGTDRRAGDSPAAATKAPPASGAPLAELAAFTRHKPNRPK